MELMDFFNNNVFHTVSLTAGIQKIPFQPNFLGSLGIFTREPIRNVDAAITVTDEGNLSIVQTTPRGGPPIEQTIPPQSIRSFRTVRLAVSDTIYAHELQSIINRMVLLSGAPDSQLVLQDLQAEVDYRLNGPNKLRQKIENTKEHMRLGAIAGVVLDADGSTLFDWTQLMGVSLPAEIAFNLAASSPTPGALASLVRQTFRAILRAAKMGQLTNVRVIALCGDQFFDELVSHPDVISAYNLYMGTLSAAPAVVRLQAGLPDVAAFTTFRWNGIDWVNYRGSDDNSTIGIAVDKCKFVPAIPGLFSEILGPGEGFEFVNQPGMPEYVRMIPDRDRNSWVKIEDYSYPMYVARRPDVLFSGRAGT